MKTVLVTGGGRGIGAAIVDELSRSDYRVVYTYRSVRGVGEGNSIFPYQLDVADGGACQALLDELDAVGLFPEILINNAGIVDDAMFHKMNFMQWESVMRINLLALFHLTQPIFCRMREKKFGRIVNISSVNANKGQAGQTNYCAAKAGIQGFTRALALEGVRHGVTVNAISPGYVATDMVMGVRQDVREQIMASIPAGRFGQPSEIAALVKFLISEESSFMTGANVEMNGGMHFS